ncbi:MAG: hypothetical protein RL563_2682 [Pseudomonadota bacterium]|jgi:hypothetical protein
MGSGMKLYDVPRNTRIVVKDEDGDELKLNFSHIDGMYSYCTDDAGNVVHLAAWTEVEIEK